MGQVFTGGSLARAYHEIAEWCGQQATQVNATRIIQPFFGFGRMASACSNGTTNIDLIDFQKLSCSIIEGVFKAKEFHSALENRPRFRKGLAHGGALKLKAMDEYSAGLIDWIAKYGTPLDVAAIGMALPSQTMRGWMSSWTGSFDGLWEKYLKVREGFKPFIPMPGAWRALEADFFDLTYTGLFDYAMYDLMIVDPPRLAQTRDSYSSGAWVRLNNVLGGTVRIKPWTKYNYFTLLDQTFRVKSKYVLFTWQDGGQPSVANIKEYLLRHGTLEDEVLWSSTSKEIHGWRLRRTDLGADRTR